MIFNQNPFNKTSEIFKANIQSPDIQSVSGEANNSLAKNDASVSKNNSDLSTHQQEHKAQDSNLDQNQMNLKDAKLPEQEKFSIKEYFKRKAQEKVMNLVNSSRQESKQPKTTGTPDDNTPSPGPSKSSPKVNMESPEFNNRGMNKPDVIISTPKMKSTSIPRVNIPKPRIR